MEGTWLVLFIAMCVLLILELAFILALARQVGVLLQSQPTGARMMNSGPQVGDPAPSLDNYDVFEKRVTLGEGRGARTLLLFVSLSCETCKGLVPTLKTLRRSEKDGLDILLAASGEEIGPSREFVREHGLVDIPFLADDELADRYQIDFVPYAVLIDEQGIVRAKGLVNTGAHLESLLTGADIGHPSLESYLEELHHTEGDNADRTTKVQELTETR